MPRRLPPGRVNEEDHVASPEASRLLATGFLVAAVLGVISGLVWIVWNLLKVHVF
jgi:hypothetical protein